MAGNAPDQDAINNEKADSTEATIRPSETIDNSSASAEYRVANVDLSKTEIEIPGAANGLSTEELDKTEEAATATANESQNDDESISIANADTNKRQEKAAAPRSSTPAMSTFEDTCASYEGIADITVDDTSLSRSPQVTDMSPINEEASIQLITTEQQENLSSDFSSSPMSSFGLLNAGEEFFNSEGESGGEEVMMACTEIGSSGVPDESQTQEIQSTGYAKTSKPNAAAAAAASAPAAESPAEAGSESGGSESEAEGEAARNEAEEQQQQLSAGADAAEIAKQAAGAAQDSVGAVIEQAVQDFCKSRDIETMRRLFSGISTDHGSATHEQSRFDDRSMQPGEHAVTGEYVKEGIVIGKPDQVGPLITKEFLLPLKDNILHVFLNDAGLFRAICTRAQCFLEITKRILNKKLCIGGRWNKFLIIRIVGPNLRNITCCDRLLQLRIPQFRARREYNRSTFCKLFFKEDMPDNTRLYENSQRTGATANRFGYLRLESPYCSTALRSVSKCPWKQGRERFGNISFAGQGTHHCMAHVYKSYGFQATAPVSKGDVGVLALGSVQRLKDQFIAKQQAAEALRKMLTVPVYR